MPNESNAPQLIRFSTVGRSQRVRRQKSLNDENGLASLAASIESIWASLMFLT